MSSADDVVKLALKLVAGSDPQKTAKAYKLFKQREGKLYPLFVDANEEVPLNQWLKAKAGEQAASGQVKSKAGPLAYRPGWHAGDLPAAAHIGAKSHGNKRLPPDTRRSDEVWAEVDMADDVDWQKVADERARITKKGTPDLKTAHITDQVPYGGFYRYKTSPTMQGNWMIGGDMRVNRILTDDEVKAINDAAGVADLPRREGYGPGGWVDDVVKMAGKVVSGEGEDAAKAGIRAYQGSPHNFAAERLVRFPEGRTEYIVGQPDVLPDVPEGAEVVQDFPLGRMRMDKIGTGEGAQAYGHGLYMAEHEPVAQGYKDALRRKGDEIIFDNKSLKEPRDYNELQSYLENQEGDWRLFKALDEITKRQGSMEDRLGDIRNWYRNQPEMLAAIDRAEKRMTLKENPGFVYEANINADPNAFLDWDKPLSEQPSLTRALGNYDPEYYVDYDEIMHKAMQSLQPVREPTGEDIYRALGHPKAATRMLNTMGVPGIRFLDAGSRVHDDTAIGMIKNYGSREKALEVAQKRLASAHYSDRASWQKTINALSRPETRNLVVFDDKLISIIRKYGIAGASAMLGYNLMEQLDPKQALAASMADQDYKSSRPQRSMGGNNSISGALNVARGLNGGE